MTNKRNSGHGVHLGCRCSSNQCTQLSGDRCRSVRTIVSASDTAACENRTTARENRTSARENRSCTRKQVFSPLVFFAVLTHLTTPTCVNASQSQFCKRISHFVQLQSHSSSGGVQRIVQLQNQGSSCNDTMQSHASLATWPTSHYVSLATWANQSIHL